MAQLVRLVAVTSMVTRGIAVLAISAVLASPALADEALDGAVVQASSTLTLTAPARTLFDAPWRPAGSWRTVDGRPVQGTVLLQRQDPRPSTLWHTEARALTDAEGQVRFVLHPADDATYRLATPAVPEALGTVSASLPLVVTPAYAKVVDAPGAPLPTPLAPQPRATTAGLDAEVSTIPSAVWADMVGRTWHAGCPVGRTGLRLIRMNYYGFDGYRHRGELVVSARVVSKVVSAFARVYAARYPIRSMRREDEFGYSRKLRGADDYASMAADNTSAFNCRQVVGQPGRRSPHAYGIAIDINTFENPDVARDGTWPSAYYARRDRDHVALLRASDPVVRAFRAIGWHWGASFRDYQHFDNTRGHD